MKKKQSEDRRILDEHDAREHKEAGERLRRALAGQEAEHGPG